MRHELEAAKYAVRRQRYLTEQTNQIKQTLEKTEAGELHLFVQMCCPNLQNSKTIHSYLNLQNIFRNKIV